MAQLWFYQTSEHQQSGPVVSGKLRRLVEAGIITPDTLVRKGDSARWIRAEKVRGLFQQSTLAPSLGATSPGPPPVVARSANPMNQEAEFARRVRGDSDQDGGDGDHHRDGDAALSEFIPKLDPDVWDEDSLEVFRCIAMAVNRLRKGPPSRNAGTSRPFSVNVDWDHWDPVVAELLEQIGHAIEQLRAAIEDGEPFPSADFVFSLDESIYHDDLVYFVRRIEAVLNGLREGQSPRAIDSQLVLFDSSETHTHNRKASTPPRNSATRAKLFTGLLNIVINIYAIGLMFSIPYFNWRYARDNGFGRWLFFGEIVATAQAAIWPVYALSGISKPEGSALTSEERAFAEQWNQWLDDHPKEVNDLRTRGIADNLTQEEISREMIGLMVRFSNEANLNIPQRFIDEIKKEGASPKKE